MIVTASISTDAATTYALPAVYILLFAATMRVGWLYYHQYKKNKKSENVKALSYFIWAVGFDALYSFFAVLIFFVLGIINPNKTIVAPLLLMILPNMVVLTAALYFYLKTIEVAD